jgi:metallo-beta-lactamase family protein
VHIFGESHRVRASVYTINGFSAHADRRELVDWQSKAHPASTYLVHGEKSAMKKLASSLPETDIRIPRMHQSFDL